MNRHTRRAHAKKGDRFVAHCKACPDGSLPFEDGKEPCCEIVVITRHGEKELGICRGCPCAAGKCDSCHETGHHWLGCPLVGLPAMPTREGTIQ